MSEFQGKICPYCKVAFKDGDDVNVCSSCGMPHHKECWSENKGCTTFGCSQQHYEATGTNISDVCGNCGAPLGDGQEFCPKCGTRKGVVNPNVCGKCGAELQPGQGFCPKCGQKAGLAVDSGVAARINQANTQTINKSKKKLFVPIAVACLAVVAIMVGVFVNSTMQTKKVDEAKSTYISDVKELKTQLLTAGTNLEDIADTVQQYWRENIYDDKHGSSIDTAIMYALVDKSDELDKAETQKGEIDELYKNVKSLPEAVKDDDDLKEICSAAKELYNAYTDFYSLATNPTGSYNSFSENNNDKTDAFLTKYRALDNLLD